MMYSGPKGGPEVFLFAVGCLTAKRVAPDDSKPYKAKGIKERGQYVLRKEGKKK